MTGRGGGRGGGRGRGGRERPHGGGDAGSGSGRGERSPRHEERPPRRTGWDVAPPSRHLWVGNLSPHVTENLLSEQFLRFGDLESIAHFPGRSYAFVNFAKVEDAEIALRGLQGLDLAGSPLKIEFTKGDRAPLVFHGEENSAYNGGWHSTERGESFSRRDSRLKRPSPERSHDKSRGDRSSEPSEILWIGFPSFLNIDEMALRRAFAPFGEIEKITAFPGRNYAFVQYRSVVSACRAKEALQGRLFNNPRVNICFAKSEPSPAEHGRSLTNPHILQNLRSSFHHGFSEQNENFERERSFDSPIGEFNMDSSRFIPNIDRMPEDSSVMGFGRNSSGRVATGPGANFGSGFDHMKLHDIGSERMISEDAYERRGSIPSIERGAGWHESIIERPPRAPVFEDSWGLDNKSFPLTKKLKIDSFPDKELPEYPFTDMERERNDTGMRKLHHTFPEHNHPYSKEFDFPPLGYKGNSEHSMNLKHPHAGSDDSWRTSDAFHPAPFSLPSNVAQSQRITPEPRPLPLKEEWKWEGTIAKGGTPVCRARCFPVGKVLDFMLPEFLDCTARTGLDMLARHYYQAASTWVVFFVPETDADIVFYNDFMHYLGEKQRAAVAKLGEKITLFLVPPSEFSEQVLKVPGKVSISGVILQFQLPSSSSSALSYPQEAVESKPPPLVRRPTDGGGFHEDISFRRPSSPEFRSVSLGQNYYSSPSGVSSKGTNMFPPPPRYEDVPPLQRHSDIPPAQRHGDILPPQRQGDDLPKLGPILPMEKLQEFHAGARSDQFQHQNSQLQSNWSSHMVSNPTPGSYAPPTTNAASHSFDNSLVEDYSLTNSKVVQGTSSSNYAPETSGFHLAANMFSQQQEAKPQVSSSMPIPLHPEQLAQLAALLGQHKHFGQESVLSAFGSNLQPSLLQTSSVLSQSSIPSRPVGPQVSQVQQSQQPSSTVSECQFSQAPALQQNMPTVTAAQFSLMQHLQPSSNVSGVQSSQLQQSQQHPSSVSTVQSVGNPDQQSDQHAQNGSRDETEADPQKRLQATLQLAAALLQQIQQQSKNTDQQ